MSLKSIDMQVSVHRNPEAGQLQQQLQHKHMEDQAALAGMADKDIIRERQRSAKIGETAESKVRDGRQSGGGGERSRHNLPSKTAEEKASTKNKEIEHPFKGHNVDLSL